MPITPVEASTKAEARKIAKKRYPTTTPTKVVLHRRARKSIYHVHLRLPKSRKRKRKKNR